MESNCQSHSLQDPHGLHPRQPQHLHHRGEDGKVCALPSWPPTYAVVPDLPPHHPWPRRLRLPGRGGPNLGPACTSPSAGFYTTTLHQYTSQLDLSSCVIGVSSTDHAPQTAETVTSSWSIDRSGSPAVPCVCLAQLRPPVMLYSVCVGLVREAVRAGSRRVTWPSRRWRSTRRLSFSS